ncbi:methyltransferase family protein [Clostridium butyricum]|uniref:methyltransferase family protein n=1 Tax=Clostridium butyricum TaxID=1492 RepID=UPI0013D4BB61|nr:isoprenylcysteine carboxylmethyltransferase family protein [Clostridium butyricum]MCQ2017672.1 isoprenylcysteine carboxylmethyltransferase family protein [Clostridium butyricum]MCQ2021464.1 isoprenylcysteine carboxylmethyltransferase family protein [Clostridium butyricum]NFB72737.1 isoprenylcysteine carboxylmethyltransferase family protein [Clostridium butyricum]NFB91973.1 isoprenylcysteine carboxylmethyltransferase family protein [Clostridium butyricum]UTY53129.1 isoprenylcysteine carboxyl
MNKQNHMSYFGVGPIYVVVTFILTAIAVYIGNIPYFSFGIIRTMKAPLLIVGDVLIVLGIVLWVQAVIISRIDKNITENKLLTTGAYAWVRNPIYSAFTIVFTGILCIQNNLILLVLPFIYWLFLSIIVKKEETVLEKTFGQEYLIYKSKVNRCIPWFPKR